MTISLFHLVRTETEQMMTAMLNVLEHAEGLVEAGKIEEDALMASSLAPDMFSLSLQVWRGSDSARAAARLAVGASSTPTTRARQAERLAELQKVGRVAMSAERAMTIFLAVKPPLAIACPLC